MRTQVHLTPQDQGRRLSWEEFSTANSQEGYRYELIDGRVHVSPIPNLPHECLREWLRRLLADYAEEHPEVVNCIHTPGRVFVSGRSDITAPEPDLVVYRDFPHHLPLAQRRWEDISPVLVLEILSEDSAAKDTERNVELYLEVPTIREYWILDPRVDPDHPTMTVYRRRGQRWQRPIAVPVGATYTTRFLPGFVLVLDPHA